MNHHHARPSHRSNHRARRQRGFTLVELLVALIIALFLLGGLLAIQQSSHKAFSAQSQLAQQDDAQRLAMTLLAEVVADAGYLTDPLTQTPTGVFTSTGLWPNAGQFINGTSGGAGASDTLVTRFYVDAASPVVMCDGTTPTSATPTLWDNTLSVANGQLMCTVNQGTPVPIVSNVQGMSVLYGVHLNPATPAGTIDSYLSAAQMPAGAWTSVVSVRVVLTFANGLTGTTGQPQTISVARNIALMAKC